jgi:predicted SAM-dependent methyltransferase
MTRITSTHPYLNLGCGGRFDTNWTNIDFRPAGPGVLRHDLTEGIPFPDRTFSAVYHSHVLEHLTPEHGQRLLQECFRVLRPGGVLRIVVPDLEDAARAYLDALNGAQRLDPPAEADHAWMLTELLDQMTRTVPGGRMRPLLEDPTIPNPEFVKRRLGGQAVNAVGRARTTPRGKFPTLLTRVRAERNYRRYTAAAVRAAADVIFRVVIGPRNWEALKVGRFRLRSGEVHQWMYDRVSLTRLLSYCGFQGATIQAAERSFIDGWEDFHLDADADGSVWLPNSLYMEARRPSAGV